MSKGRRGELRTVDQDTPYQVSLFSESLHHELKPRGVMVTVVNPGLVVTEGFFPKGSPILTDPLTKPFLMKPERVARAIVDVIRHRRGREVAVPRCETD